MIIKVNVKTYPTHFWNLMPVFRSRYRRRRAPFRRRNGPVRGRALMRRRTFRPTRPPLYKQGWLHKFIYTVSNLNSAVGGTGVVVTPSGTETQVASIGNGPGFLSLGFTLNDLPNLSELSNMFDFFRITGIQLNVAWRDMGIPTSGTTVTTPPLYQSYPHMYVITDYDDNTAPTSINELRQYRTCKRIEFTHERRTARFFLRPRVVVDSDFQLKQKPWIDMASPATLYHGMKFAFVANSQFTLPPDVNYQIWAKYYVVCKGQR